MKQFYWIVQYNVGYDADHIEQDRILFYGTYKELKDTLITKNQVFIDKEIVLVKDYLRRMKSQLKQAEAAKVVYDNADSELKQVIKYDAYDHQYLRDEVERIKTRLKDVIKGNWKPKYGDSFWSYENFHENDIEGFNWIYDDEDNSIIGFEKS